MEATAQRTVRPAKLTTAAWAVAVIAWLGLSFASFLRNTSGGIAWALGSFVGTAVLSLAIALALRWVYLKLAEKTTGLEWSPSVFATAAVIALISAATGIASHARDPEDLLDVELPAGYTYAELEPSAERDLRRGFERNGEQFDKLALRSVRSGGDVVAVAGALRLKESGKENEFVDGFNNAGGRARKVPLGGGEAWAGRADNVSVVFDIDGREVVLVYADTEREALKIAEPLALD